MCLFVTIKPELAKNEYDELATSLTDHSPFYVGLGTAEYSHTLHVSLDEELGCSCSMLDDNADWNAKVWLFRDDILVSLADMIRLCATQCQEHFTFEALWDGDYSETKEVIHIDALTTIIKKNQIRNKHRYEVKI